VFSVWSFISSPRVLHCSTEFLRAPRSYAPTILMSGPTIGFVARRVSVHLGFNFADITQVVIMEMPPSGLECHRIVRTKDVTHEKAANELHANCPG